MSATTLGTDPDRVAGAAADATGANPEDPVASERTRWAYAIHDGLTQVVTAAVLELESLARRAEMDPGGTIDALTEAATELRRALDEIRGILSEVSPGEPGPHPPLEEVIQGVLDRWQLPATWTVEGDLTAVPERVLDVASSVVREALANAARHAAPTEVAVHARTSAGVLELLIEDHGSGFEPTGSDASGGHLGLEMMRRRVVGIGGTLRIESSPGIGTRVVARLPLEQGAAT